MVKMFHSELIRRNFFLHSNVREKLKSAMF